MAMEYVVQRLEMGDVVLIDLREQGQEVEAKVVEPIDRTKTTVRVSLRVAGREDFVKEWPLGEKVTVVRGPGTAGPRMMTGRTLRRARSAAATRGS
jgi:hypothetical protein